MLLAVRNFVDALLPALQEAAELARALEGQVRNRPKPGEVSDVKAALTHADTAAQEALLRGLLVFRDCVELEAEEDTPSVRHFRIGGEWKVVIDPIDGTYHSYLHRRGPYAVMLGLSRGGRYCAGLIALPREQWCYTAVRGEGVRMLSAGGEVLQASLTKGARRVLVSHELPSVVAAALTEHGFEALPGCGGAVALAPLLPGFSGGLRVVPESGSVSVRGRIGAFVAREAGAWVHCERGVEFPDDLDTPACALLTAADAETLTALEQALRAAH